MLGIGNMAYAATPTATASTTASPTYQVPTGVTITSPFQQSFDVEIKNILNKVTFLFFFVVGVVLIGLIVYAGILYITDAGNEESAKKAKKIMTSAIIGLFIIGFTGMILRFIEAILGINLGI